MNKHSFILLCFLWIAPSIQAQHYPYMITHLAFGSYVVNDGHQDAAGSSLSMGGKLVLSDLYSYYSTIRAGSAQRTKTLDDGRSAKLKQSDLTLSAGGELRYQVIRRITPFVQAGLAIQSYRVDFSDGDPDSVNHSGTGFGPDLGVGVRFRLGKHITLLPAYHYRKILITGGALVYQGSSLALIASF